MSEPVLIHPVETGIKKRYEKDELFPNGLNRLFFGDCLSAAPNHSGRVTRHVMRIRFTRLK